MSEKRILVVGSLNMDQVVRVPRLPALGETLLGAGSLKLVPGGKGANQAAAMARLGAPVTMAGRVGREPFGEQLLASLRADGVETGLVAVDEEEASGTAFIFLGPQGDNAIVVSGGANMRVGYDREHFRRITEALPEASALVLQMEIPVATVNALVLAGHAAGVPVILNAAPAEPLPAETLRQLDVLIVNETEALTLAAALDGGRELGAIETPEEARAVASLLHAQGITTVVVTLGAQGALLVTDDGAGAESSLQQAAPIVEVVDTTAAGDCFVGAFTVALSEGRPLEEALRFAVYAGALKVTKFGAQSGLPTRTEVERFLDSRS